jgi:molybdate transport system substrate-binding protein
MRRITLLALLGACLHAPAGSAAPLRVAVAANFAAPLRDLALLYERAQGATLLISSGSSGQLYAQIREGAPFDVFLSADIDKPQRLEAEGLAVPGSRFVYAIGALVLWSPKAGVVDANGNVLRSGAYQHLAIANPQTAPYGTAAQQVLRRLDLWDSLDRARRIVVGENITQAWQFTATGNAELGFVALSQVLQIDGTIGGSHWRVPQSMYDPIQQAAVLLAASSQRDSAQAFLSWLRDNPTALAVIRAAGYRTAD